MRVASFCSLPIGLIPWTGSEPMLSVVVKATFSLAADGEAPLASEQEPLRVDEPDPLSDAAGLRYASDFAPRKARADILVVGHAHAADRVNTIPIRMTFDVLDKQLVARSAEATTRIPLVARHLRTNESTNASPVALGPRSAWSPERIAFGGAALGAHGAPLEPLGDDFDFQFFNAAPVDQQVGVLRPNGVMTLDGLMPGGGRRHAWLPGHRPRVFHFGERGPGDVVAEVPVACDTLWIDTDRAICVLVWRGVVPLARASETPATFVLSLEPRGAARGWSALRDALGAARWESAPTPADFAGPPDGGGADFALAAARAAADGDDGDDDREAGETLTAVRPPNHREPRTLVRRNKIPETLPLVDPASISVDPPSSGDAPTHVDAREPAARPPEVLAPLFVRNDGALDLAVPSSADPWGGTTQEYLPLRSEPAPVTDDEPTLLRADRRDDDDRTTLGAQAVAAPRALLAIDAYAELRAEIAMGRDPRDAIFGARGVSAETFDDAERRYDAALAAEAARGGDALSARLQAALDRARRRLAERGSRA